MCCPLLFICCTLYANTSINTPYLGHVICILIVWSYIIFLWYQYLATCACRAAKSPFTLRIRMGLQKEPTASKIERPTYYERKRMELKQDKAAYESFKKADAEMKRAYRRSLSDEQRRKQNEKTKLRMRKMRERREIEGHLKQKWWLQEKWTDNDKHGERRRGSSA